MTIRVSGIDHIVMNTHDVAATAKWYRHAIGAHVESYGFDRTALTFGSQKINLRPVGTASWETATVDAPGSLDVCFVTESTIDEVVTAWKAAGIPVHEGPIERTGARGPMLSVYALDPDGNLVEVASYS